MSRKEKSSIFTRIVERVEKVLPRKQTYKTNQSLGTLLPAGTTTWSSFERWTDIFSIHTWQTMPICDDRSCTHSSHQFSTLDRPVPRPVVRGLQSLPWLVLFMPHQHILTVSDTLLRWHLFWLYFNAQRNSNNKVCRNFFQRNPFNRLKEMRIVTVVPLAQRDLVYVSAAIQHLRILGSRMCYFEVLFFFFLLKIILVNSKLPK